MQTDLLAGDLLDPHDGGEFLPTPPWFNPAFSGGGPGWRHFCRWVGRNQDWQKRSEWLTLSRPPMVWSEALRRQAVLEGVAA